MPTAAAAKAEHRYAELRALAEGSRTLEGTIVEYGDEARIGAVRERIEPGAFAPLPEHTMLTVQHVRAAPIARGGAGLVLADSPRALEMRATLPPTPRADQALADVRAGILRGLSVEMIVRRETWEAGVRVIHDAQIVRIALVDDPAYPRSEVVAREAKLKVERRRRFYL